MKIVLYSKPGCHLCEGLQEKLEQINSLPFELETRDITTRDDWFQAYQYEIPVLYLLKDESLNSSSSLLPRPSPRATVQQLEKMLQKYMSLDR
ncbi:MAG: glutaredoxin family protein [Leptolyngbyaceae cyanobacterium CSU_1_3]|nr:glutaredoxin family protein [Leptolyngbyaceae cyanobacterium CSU_1_3]